MRWPGAKKIKQSTGHWQEVRCAGHGMRWPGAKKNQSATGRKCAVLATACGWPGAKKIKQSTGSGGGRILCWPRREVARSQKIQQSTGHWQEVRCAGHGVRLARSQKIQQSTGHWQDVRCAGHGVWWPGAKKIKQSSGSGGDRMCAVLATSLGGEEPKKTINWPLAGSALCWPWREVARSHKNTIIKLATGRMCGVLATACGGRSQTKQQSTGSGGDGGGNTCGVLAMTCGGQEPKEYNNQPAVVVAGCVLCWPRREVARSQKKTINPWCGGRTWGVIRREVAAYQGRKKRKLSINRSWWWQSISSADNTAAPAQRTEGW